MRDIETPPGSKDFASGSSRLSNASDPLSPAAQAAPQAARAAKEQKLRRWASPREELSIELTRKSIHLLIAFVPLLSAISKPLTIGLLAGGILTFSACEAMRLRGVNIPLISYLTAKAARIRDTGKFVLGPVTLGLGALAAVLLFKEKPAAIAVYTLAFGDGLTSLVGKAYGSIRIPFTRGKSVEGAFTCFVVSFLSAFLVSRRVGPSLGIALLATVVEALPTLDWDNLLLPLAVGCAATLMGF